MNFEEYIAALLALKTAIENRFIAVIPYVEQFALQALLDWIDKSLDIRKGSLTASDETIAILNDFDSYFLQVLSQMKEYNGAVSGMIKDLPKFSKLMQQYQEETNGISWAKANVAPVQKLVVNEIIDAYSENGLNQNFVQPLRDLLYQNIAAGTSVKDAKESLTKFVKSEDGKDSKISRYITQTSQQAVDSYTGIINKKLMDTFDYGYLQMSGSLIKTSAPQCVKGINGYEGLISEEVFENVLKPLGEKNGLIAGTDFKNLPFNRLHWGCRHEFTPTMVKMDDKPKTDDKSKEKILNNKSEGAPVRYYDKEEIKRNLAEYNEFKKGYTKEFFNYKTGGYVIVQDGHGKTELENNLITARLLARTDNKVVLVRNIKNQKSFDALLNGTETEFKMISDAGKNISNSIQNHFDRGIGQSENILIHVNQKYNLKDLSFGLEKAIEKHGNYYKTVSILFRNGRLKEFSINDLAGKNEKSIQNLIKK